ncbi:thioredoxin-disulfide reductase [Candidatus Deianiraea vastatrix]|uniref:Thioredoxin reductase n=1 Tax=Candidatus Deianiraea vastatrix TaxID=2163644 RepID=A0A5B8XED4_9RICK|nr:thioredoxin-disulfide reductase [Candidatus Deianiraea vastatrix]QED23336.1 Thioredoxin reductase [Candidatus Deianiraea vastatrix]
MARFETKVLIIGSGPAGYTAGIYTSRANLKTILVTGEQPGGQLTITTDVENYPGFEKGVQGPELMEIMQKQAEHCGVKVDFDFITEVDFANRPFVCKSANGNEYVADSIIIATGAQAKWLGLGSENEFKGYGVSGCATCDGFFYRGKTVCVVGGGNTAVEEAIYLTKHAKKVYLIHRKDKLRAEKIMQDRLFANEKIEVKWNRQILEICGQKDPLKFVEKVILGDENGNKIEEIALDGVFIAIGHRPNTSIFNGKIALDDEGYIITEKGSTKTSIAGVFAAGDVQDKVYRQAITAAGTGCMAALEAQHFLDN